MNGNTEMLNFIFQNSQMGVTTIEQLLGIVEDENLKKHLQCELNEYTQIADAAQKAINESGQDEKGISTFEKIRTYLMINIQTLIDKSPSHIAEMLIVGSNMGIIDATKNLKKYKNAQQEILNLMDRLLKFEESNVQQLKQFL